MLIESAIEFAIVHIPAIRRAARRAHMRTAPGPLRLTLIRHTPGTEATIGREIPFRILLKHSLVLSGSKPEIISFVVGYMLIVPLYAVLAPLKTLICYKIIAIHNW